MKATLLDVKGMTCQSCVRHVNEALTHVNGVQQVDVRLREGQVLVEHDPSVATVALVEALVEAGYASQATR